MKIASIETTSCRSSSRRDFLKLTVTAAIGGGLLLGFGLPARAEIRDKLTTDAPFAPNAFLRIDRTGKVTFVMPFIEMGQGTYTSIPMLIAEELEVDVDKVAIEHSPPDDKVYVNPLIGVQMTGGSTAIRGTYVPLRRAGATARVMLVRAAAQRWNVDPVHLSRGERRGRARADRPQARLRQARRCRREAAGAGEGRTQGAGRLQADRNAASAPRHRRQGQRQREVRHRHPTARE